MRIGIISDTHDQQDNLKRALTRLRTEGIDLLVHCGDMTGLETALQLVEFRVIYAYGNIDTASGAIREALLAYDARNFGGPVFSGEVGGVPLAVIHGDRAGSVENLANSGKFRYVFHGHTHVHRHLQIGSARVINPGALGGLQREARSLCVLDLDSGDVQFWGLDG